jgi:hypothetical protein
MIVGLKEGSQTSISICTIIAELAEALLCQEYPISTCIISVVYEELLRELLGFIMIEDMHVNIQKARIAGFSALYNLLQYAPRDCEDHSINFMEHSFGLLSDSVHQGVELDPLKEELQGFFLCAIQCILTNVERNLNPEIGDRLVEVIIEVFKQRGCVFDEAFLCFSAIANKFPGALNDKINQLGPFLIYGLKSGNAAIIRNVCGLISDLCTLVESPGVISGFEEYMPLLLNHLRDPETDSSAQIIIIALIGDTFLLTKTRFKAFLADSLSILEGASLSSIQPPVDLVDKELKMQYQSALIEAYTCFFQNINEADESSYQELGSYVMNIFKFLMDILDQQFNPSKVSF